MVDLETINRQLVAESQSLQEELAAREEELLCQKRELEQLGQHHHQQETIHHQQVYQQKGEHGMMGDMNLSQEQQGETTCLQYITKHEGKSDICDHKVIINHCKKHCCSTEDTCFMYL